MSLKGLTLRLSPVYNTMERGYAMNLPVAIKILGEHVEWCDPVKEVDTYNALNLGIEALRRIEATRLIRKIGTVVLLPGETKE